MPTTLPSSFASAAAGGAGDGSGRSPARGDGGMYGDWSRRPNGATQTFRRSSTATSQSSTNVARDSIPSASSNQLQGAASPSYTLGNMPRHGPGLDMRYSKAQLLDLFREQREQGDLDDIPSGLFVGDVDLSISNGQSSTKWVRRDERMADFPSGPEVCWDRDGSVEPLGLIDLTDEEKELFTNSVNSPLKAPTQTGHREGAQRESTGVRKSSMSQGYSSGNAFGLSSPTATKTSGRRREPSESFPFSKDAAPSPSVSNKPDFPAATPPASLLRRKTDFRESSSALGGEGKEMENTDSPFSYKMRSVTGPLSAGLNPPSSPWSTTAQADVNSPMGSFGSFGLGRSSTEKRPGFGAARGDSRFRNFMTKAPLDEESELREKESMSSLGKFRDQESTGDRPSSRGMDAFVGDDPTREIDAAGFDTPSRLAEYGMPARADMQDDHVLSSLGMNTNTSGYASFAERQRGERFNASQFQPTAQIAPDSVEPMSPTFTNPYQSPQQQSFNLREAESEELDMASFHLPGLGNFQEEQSAEHRSSPFGSQQTLNRTTTYDVRQPDRIQTSGPASARGLPGLGGLGGLHGLGSPGPWSSNVAPGMPARDKSTFGDAAGDPSIRSPAAPQSSGYGGLGGSGRGRLGSLFSSSMQEQMRAGDQNRPLKSDEEAETAEELNTPYGSGFFGNNMTVGSGLRGDVDSPFRQGRGKFDDFFNAIDRPSKPDSSTQSSVQNRSPGQVPSSLQPQQVQAAFGSTSFQQTQQQGTPRTPGLSTPGSGQPPAPQQKTMVMPDRIRWIYRDPQGNTQGPWSGLEMHDWYRAGFFSPELLVKKVEDPDYEPLAQLIRRIGNSREPFLVPQIGIPGPPSSQGSGWPNPAPTATAAPPPAGLSAQPPFAGSFPSFGTTLTAEQQNALERRKQEEQYLMARQKEHLAQQQVLVKQLQMQNQPGIHSAQLHHHSSAHSLHSQPSFSSVTSPNTFQNSPMSGQNGPGGFDSTFRSGGGAGFGAPGSHMDSSAKQEETGRAFERLNLGRTAQSIQSRPQFQEFGSAEQRAAMVLEDRANLFAEQNEEDMMQRQAFEQDDFGADRLHHFQNLREDLGAEGADESRIHTGPAGLDEELYDTNAALAEGMPNEPVPFPMEDVTLLDTSILRPTDRSLSLTEQVQKAASANKTPTDAVQSPWAKIDVSATERPPQSASPLPAPAAQRSRQNVADALAAESTSQSASPSIESSAPSLAPWARDPSDVQKQPSLKEIQEAEARRAAKQEEAAAAARRATLEKELANQMPLPAPGLPSSSTWGSTESPVTPSSANASAWTKPLAGKTAPAQSGSTKKTLAQIQKEQEALARKQKAATAGTASAIAVAGSAQTAAAGKRYAEMAGKVASTTPPAAPGGSWTTVGAGGKAKAPPIQTTSIATTKPLANLSNQTPTTARPKPITNPSSSTPASAQASAMEEFKKWAIAELRPDLNKGIIVEDFVTNLLNFPSDTEVLTEAVHGVSQTMDSRHFAEEFVRRRGLAEKGKMEVAASSTASASTPAQEVKGGGWSEVARKGPASATPKEESSAFKVVSKKKGSKR